MSGLWTPPEPKLDDSGPKVRILFCDKCRSVQEVPEYNGPPEYDQLLQYRIAEHQFDSGTAHPLHLGRVAKSVWDKREARDGIIQKFAVEQGYVVPGEGAGLGATFYALKDNFQAEAMKCWKQHNRTTDCQDYRSKSKELLADTKAERKAEGMSTSRADRPKHWLCSYCPMESLVQQKRNEQKGMYR